LVGSSVVADAAVFHAIAWVAAEAFNLHTPPMRHGARLVRIHVMRPVRDERLCRLGEGGSWRGKPKRNQ
jgi:hypothetical protein